MDTVPSTRNVELITSEVDVPGPCCLCGAKDGVVKCSQCKAVRFCGEECQKKGWKDHKRSCNEISQKVEETTAAIDALANLCGGTAALSESTRVKVGQFPPPRPFLVSTPPPYLQARWSLAEAYAKCGQEMSSRIAIRLAVENFLDILCLTRNNRLYNRFYTYFLLLKGCSWMVVVGMDQLALNLLCYFARREQPPHPFPYSDTCIDADIEGASCITAMQELVSQFTAFSVVFQGFMLISLIKFKRLQALLVEVRKEDARWNAFMEGTYHETGASSVVLRLAGVDLVTEKIREYVMDQSIHKRVALLAMQINGLLWSVNQRNPKLILGVIDRKTLEHPTLPDWDETEFFRRLFNHGGATYVSSEQRHLDTARYAAIIYGHAWHMDREYTGALRLFLDTGNVMAEERNTGHVKAEEATGHEKAEEEDTGNAMAVEKDNGSEKADTGQEKAEEEDTGHEKEDDTGYEKAGEEDSGHEKAKEDTGHEKAEEYKSL